MVWLWQGCRRAVPGPAHPPEDRCAQHQPPTRADLKPSPHLLTPGRRCAEVLSDSPASHCRLLEFIHPSQLPSALGGALDCALNDVIAEVDKELAAQS